MKLFHKHLFTPRWLLPTLLVIAALTVLIRLGFWQLDRLSQRREANSKIIFQMEQSPVLLSGQALAMDLSEMEYRRVVVEGVYDHAHQVVLMNQVFQDQYGAHLLTPLRVRGSDQAILIDRGWIPMEDVFAAPWRQYDEPGEVIVSGVIRLPQSKPDFGRISDPTPVPGGERIIAWNLANLEQMEKQMPYPLMSIYVQQSPSPSWTKLPYRTEPDLDLTEGSHFSYALQWFTFAAILAVGYPLYMMRVEGVLSGRKPGLEKSVI